MSDNSRGQVDPAKTQIGRGKGNGSKPSPEGHVGAGEPHQVRPSKNARKIYRMVHFGAKAVARELELRSATGITLAIMAHDQISGDQYRQMRKAPTKHPN